MRALAAGSAHVGLVREVMEDAFLVLDDASAYAVADGLGGPGVGPIATRVALEEVWRSVRAREPLEEAFTRASRRLLAHNAQSRRTPAATTLTAAQIDLATATMRVAHVGESRLYRYRAPEGLRLLSRDQVRVLANPPAPPDEDDAAFGPFLSMALGFQEQPRVVVAREEVRVGDVVLLCTDGLSGEVYDREIASVLAADPDPASAAASLVDKTMERGAPDNVAVVVVRLVD
jgi:serine/threonine protein phosphatase PrpC